MHPCRFAGAFTDLGECMHEFDQRRLNRRGKAPDPVDRRFVRGRFRQIVFDTAFPRRRAHSQASLISRGLRFARGWRRPRHGPMRHAMQRRSPGHPEQRPRRLVVLAHSGAPAVAIERVTVPMVSKSRASVLSCPRRFRRPSQSRCDLCRRD